jgi:hypothetical protein
MAVGNRTGTSREPIGEGAIVTGQEQPHDPVLRVVADYWEGIRRYADPGQWQRLTDLIGGAAEEEADEARAALADELLDILPPHHPASQLLRTGIMYSGDQPDRPEAEPADDLRRLSRLVLARPGPGWPEASAAASPATPAPVGAGAPVGDFDRQVQARLLALPSLSADDPRSRSIALDRGLLRLPRPDGTAQLPAFQFGPSGAPWPVVREINELLDAADDPWGAACWWADPHERLGAAPAGLLGRDQDDLLRLAATTVGKDY